MEEILASIRRIIADDQSLPARGLTPSAAAGEATADGHDAPRGQIQDTEIQERAREPRTSGSKSNERPLFRGPPSERGAYGAAGDSAQARATPAQERSEPGDIAGSVEYPDHDVEEGEAFYDTPIEPAVAPERRATREASAPPRASTSPLRNEPPETPPLFSASTDTAVQAAFNMLAASRLANNSDEIMTLAREMIRPLLRTWIDENLPSMVERMVRAEIERVSRGR